MGEGGRGIIPDNIPATIRKFFCKGQERSIRVKVRYRQQPETPGRRKV
jgi:hypothetical protein